jgi:hypothetical protein
MKSKTTDVPSITESANVSPPISAMPSFHAQSSSYTPLSSYKNLTPAESILTVEQPIIDQTTTNFDGEWSYESVGELANIDDLLNEQPNPLDEQPNPFIWNQLDCPNFSEFDFGSDMGWLQ